MQVGLLAQSHLEALGNRRQRAISDVPGATWPLGALVAGFAAIIVGGAMVFWRISIARYTSATS